MVDVGQVSSDASSVSSGFSSYNSSISGVAGSWEGPSYDNFNSKASSFVADFQGTIQGQLSSFEEAVNAYNKYIQAQKNRDIAKENIAEAQRAKNSSAESDWNSKYDGYVQEMSTYKAQIESALASASSTKLEAKSLGKALGNFVNYYQGNYSEPYSQGTIATSGCGPTSLAMVLTYLLGKEVSPVETAALGNGTYTCDKGTTWNYFGDMAERYGVKCEEMGVSSSNIADNLKNGKTLIMSMGPGHFTNNGHFIVLRGFDDNGKVIVADPASEERTNQTWDLDVFVNEGAEVWAFSN